MPQNLFRTPSPQVHQNVVIQENSHAYLGKLIYPELNFSRSLLSYNLHTIKFTCLKYTNRCFFYIFTESFNHPYNLILERFMAPKMKLCNY